MIYLHSEETVYQQQESSPSKIMQIFYRKGLTTLQTNRDRNATHTPQKFNDSASTIQY